MQLGPTGMGVSRFPTRYAATHVLFHWTEGGKKGKIICTSLVSIARISVNRVSRSFVRLCNSDFKGRLRSVQNQNSGCGAEWQPLGIRTQDYSKIGQTLSSDSLMLLILGSSLHNSFATWYMTRKEHPAGGHVLSVKCTHMDNYFPEQTYKCPKTDRCAVAKSTKQNRAIALQDISNIRVSCRHRPRGRRSHTAHFLLDHFVWSDIRTTVMHRVINIEDLDPLVLVLRVRLFVQIWLHAVPS